MKTICGCDLDLRHRERVTCEHGRRWVGWDSGWPGWDNGTIIEVKLPSPVVVCLCGSTRFSEAFQAANLNETLKGHIVLTIGCDTKKDDDLFGGMPAPELVALKERLDVLHFRKIDLADEVLILNVDGYIGESTARELAYARAIGKKVRFLESEVTRQRYYEQEVMR